MLLLFLILDFFAVYTLVSTSYIVYTSLPWTWDALFDAQYHPSLPTILVPILDLLIGCTRVFIWQFEADVVSSQP